MKISGISQNQYNQNFNGVYKIASKHMPKGSTAVSFVSEKGRYLGIHMTKPNGDVSGERLFSGKYSIAYDTSHGTLFKNPYVILEYRHPINRKEQGRKLLVFDLEKFKEKIKELTSLKGIKAYFNKIEHAPSKTTYEPCC